MSWIFSNWVEQRAARDRHLRNTAEIWRQVQSCIAEACDSLDKYYPDVATLRQTKQNDNIVLIAITRTASSSVPHGEGLRSRLISLEFNPDKGALALTVDGMVTHEFTIDADSDHAFVTLHGQELLLDEFSRLVLEEAFFSPPTPKALSRQQDPDKALEMARELIRTLDAASDAQMDRIAATQNPE